VLVIAEVKFSKLKDFLIRKERSFSFLSGLWISLLGSLALGLSIEYTWNIDNHFYLLIIIPLIVTFAPFAFDAGYFTSIDLVHSDDKPKSFWSKNRN
jgi:hypothetical protein